MNTGATRDFFHSWGNLPDDKDKLKRWHTEGLSSLEHSFNIRVGIPSGPGALYGSSCDNTWWTSDSDKVGRTSWGTSDRVLFDAGRTSLSSVNVVKKYLLNASALSLADVKVLLLYFILVGMELLLVLQRKYLQKRFGFSLIDSPSDFVYSLNLRSISVFDSLRRALNLS